VQGDSEFLDGWKYLLLRPGFLSKEYLRGRRTSYLHPIRMYVFTSAVFFLIFFAFVTGGQGKESSEKANEGNKSIEQHIHVLQDSLKKTTDSAERKKIETTINGLNLTSSYIKRYGGDTRDSSTHQSNKDENVLPFGTNQPKTIREYDSIQKTLPESERDNWLTRMITYRTIAINQTYKGDEERFNEAFAEKFKHSVPYMMFVSLPLVALVMQLLYVRRRKQFFYVDHLIVLIHIYIAVFISLLIYYRINSLYDATHLALFEWIATIIGIYIFLYGFMAMKNFYGQGIFKTFFKYFILLFVGSILTAILMGMLIITSFLQV